MYRKCLGGPRFFDVDTSGGHMAGMGQTSVHLYRRLQEITGGMCIVKVKIVATVTCGQHRKQTGLEYHESGVNLSSKHGPMGA